MVDFTLVELHFEEGPISSLDLGRGTTPAGDDSEADAAAAEPREGTDGAGPDVGALLAVLLALGLLAAAAAAVKRFGGDPPAELEELDELAEV